MSILKKLQLQLSNAAFMVIFGVLETFLITKLFLTGGNKYKNKPKRILVVCLDNIGDLLFTTPIVRGLKKSISDVNITMITNSERQDIYRYNDCINSMFFVDLKMTRTKIIINLFRLIKNVASYDLAVVLERNRLYARMVVVALMLAGIKNIIWGHTYLPIFYRLCERSFLVRKDREDYIVDFYRSILAKIGIDIENNKLELDYSQADMENVDKYMRSKNIKSLFYIAYCPFANYYGEYSRTVSAKFSANLIEKVLNINSQFKICVIGNGRLKLETDKIIEMLKNVTRENIINTCGAFNINELAYFLRNSALLITVDTGVMHVGISQEIEIISLFGPTVSCQRLPKTYLDSIVLGESDCIQCSSFYMPPRKKCKSNCNESFDLGEVANKYRKIIEERL
jgi:ADP-heptose:LPS heptosyltransferase